MKNKRLFPVLLTCLLPLLAVAQNNRCLDYHTWALTPPMGWNSWDCFGPTVMESEVKTNADYMAEHLAEYGWEYIVVDIRWFVENDKAGGYNQTNPIYVYDEYGRYMPAVNRFPSAANGMGFKPLADYVHSKGLKFGIHIMRGLPKVAAQKKLPVKGTKGITCDMIANNDSACTWLRDNYKVDYSKPGAQEYYNSIFELYASWGVDFIKIDDIARPYHKAEIEMIRRAIDHCGRPIVLSISPGETPLGEVEHVKTHANMWRTVDDFWDNWSQLNYQFQVCAKWAPHIAAGTWPDADMLPLGRISIRGERGAERWCGFTEDEQYTMMNLWTIFKSPLMYGGHLPMNREEDNRLLTNRDVLYMHSHSVGNRQLSREDNRIIWSADDPANGDKFVALFNASGAEYVNPKKAIYRSGTISYLTTGYATDVEAAIPEGSTTLVLIATDGGDSYECDHADWINPVVTLADGTTIDLTEQGYVHGTCGWGSIHTNKNLNGGTLTIDGKTYKKGFATHANSMLLFDIPENAVKFTARAGLDKTGTDQGSKSSVEFMVFTEDPTYREEVTDGNAGSKVLRVDPAKQIATSGLVSRKAESRNGQTLQADITGAKKLYLVVTNGGDGLSYDHADWANPVLIDAEGNETALGDVVNWDANPINGWNSPRKNRSNDGNAIRVKGTTYAKGFGTNAPSMLTFTLPEEHDYVAFKSVVGYDDEVKNAPSGSSVTMEFRVFTEDPAPVSYDVVPLDLKDLGFAAGQACTVTEMWENVQVGVFKDAELVDTLRAHASRLYRISAVERADVASVTVEAGTKQMGGVPFDVIITVTGAAEGYVQLHCDDKILGSVAIDKDGKAVYTCRNLHPGTYTIKALYSGTASVANCVSDPITINVEGETSLENISAPSGTATYDAVYTLSGQRVVGSHSALESGIYVSGGEKFIVEY